MLLRMVIAAIVPVLLSSIARGQVDPYRVEESLTRAKDYLYKQQTDDNWEKDLQFHGDQKTGHTALVVYALLSAGESHTDPRVAKAIEYIRRTDTTGIYALGVRCVLWNMIPQTPEVKRAMLKDSTALRNGMITDGDGRGFYPYNVGLKPWSHSRAQYAVLGLWSAVQSGVEVPNNWWNIVERSWIAHQDPSGAWGYKEKATTEYPLTPGMTAVGVATLYITQDQLHASDGGARGNPVNPAIDKGMKWLIDNFDKVATDEKYDRDFQYATLYAIERVGVASGLKYFGTIDWYDKGAAWLLKKQFRSGAWPAEMSSNIHSTCFAVLFLARGRAPLAMNKLDYAADPKKPTTWNQRPRDVANISRYIGKQIERDINWQTVNLSAPVQDWHEAPILYISGSDALALDQPAKDKIKLFIQQGGLVLGNADAGSRNFTRTFRELGEALFGEYEFRELPADHPIYTNQQFQRESWKSKPSVLGISNGIRELMLLLPQADPARFWQTQAVAGKEELWQLGSNIFLYAADQQNLRKRGELHLIALNSNVKPTTNLKLARIKHSGNWDPEPAGWTRLSNLLHNRNKIAVEIAAVDLTKDSLEGVKLAHLTSAGKLVIDEPSRDTLRQFVEAGGTLLIDAAGGNSEAADALEALVTETFPGAALNPIARDDELFAAGPMPPLKVFKYRRYATRMVGDLKDEPRLKSIQRRGRHAVIFSREDLTQGLTGSPIDGIIGYTPETATEIVQRIAMDAAK